MIFREVIQRDNEPYLIRFHLTPKTRWGQLFLHIFYRGDGDPDPHDHPYDFWTCPLGRIYAEEVYDDTGICMTNMVWPWHWHYRPATYRHRVLDDEDGARWMTLVWVGNKYREWYFYTNKGMTPVHNYDYLEER